MSTVDSGDAGVEPRVLSDRAKELLAKMTPLEAQIVLAKRGNRTVLPHLRKSLDEHPELWKHYGDLSLQAQQLLIEAVGGNDLYVKECVVRQVEDMKRELAGPDPTPLEKLLVGRVAAAWLRVQYIEALEAQAPGGEPIKLAEYRSRRQQVADNQLLAAVRMLTIVRTMMARTITVEVRQAAAPPPANPIIPVAHGEEPGLGNVPVNRINGMAGAVLDKPANGHNRLNGHSAAHALVGACAGTSGYDHEGER
jgi:hypothetical protein